MATFPALKTGAVAQYPSDRQQNFSTQVYRFLDGSEQRFPAYVGSLRRWVVRLDLLDEAELESWRIFSLVRAGGLESFEFTDPFDGRFIRVVSLMGMRWSWFLVGSSGERRGCDSGRTGRTHTLRLRQRL